MKTRYYMVTTKKKGTYVYQAENILVFFKSKILNILYGFAGKEKEITEEEYFSIVDPHGMRHKMKASLEGETDAE